MPRTLRVSTGLGTFTLSDADPYAWTRESGEGDPPAILPRGWAPDPLADVAARGQEGGFVVLNRPAAVEPPAPKPGAVE